MDTGQPFTISANVGDLTDYTIYDALFCVSSRKATGHLFRLFKLVFLVCILPRYTYLRKCQRSKRSKFCIAVNRKIIIFTSVTVPLIDLGLLCLYP